jgi:hypothetical protein
MRPIRMLLGFALVVSALWPGLTASRIFSAIILPALKNGPNDDVHNTVFIAGMQLTTSWQVNVVTVAMGLLALLMVIGGLSIALSRTDDAEERGDSL